MRRLYPQSRGRCRCRKVEATAQLHWFQQSGGDHADHPDDRGDQEDPAGGIAVATGTAPALVLRGLTLNDPDGTAKVGKLDFVVQPGERWLISGHPGAAIRLFKAVAGLWPWGSGAIDLPADPHQLDANGQVAQVPADTAWSFTAVTTAVVDRIGEVPAGR